MTIVDNKYRYVINNYNGTFAEKIQDLEIYRFI